MSAVIPLPPSFVLDLLAKHCIENHKKYEKKSQKRFADIYSKGKTA